MMGISDTKKILIVEDESSWQELLQKFLRLPQFQTIVATSYEEAESSLKNDTFDLVTINVNLVSGEMQDGLGVDLLKILQKDYPDLPRIAITGAKFGGVYSKFSPFDVDDVLIKGTFTRDQLIEAIDNAIKKRQNNDDGIKLSHVLNQKIVSFLTSIPNIDDKDAQRALIQGARLDVQLRNQINFGGPPAQFFQLLITTLHDYGRLEDGRNPIVAVLEIAKNTVGSDRQKDCEKLVKELYKSIGEEPKDSKTRNTNTSQTGKTIGEHQTGQAVIDQKKRNESSQTITWLHLSDFHFHASQAYNTNIVLQELLKDVSERIKHDTLSPDFIIVTGDIAFSGKQEEYALATQFFDDLLKTTNLPREMLFLVPGNHDIDRQQISITAQALGSHLTNRDRTNTLLGDPDEFRIIMKRFETYAEFVQNYWGGQRIVDATRYFEVHQIEIADTRIALLALNSAWLCASDQDKQEGLLIGERQIRTALDQASDAQLKLALLHHPFDWLREFDQNDSATLLTDKCSFVLHGHLHRGAVTGLSSPDSGATMIAGGACYETREHPNSYNFVRLNVNSGEGMIYLRRYSDERGGFWTKDVMTYRNTPDGEYHFNFK